MADLAKCARAAGSLARRVELPTWLVAVAIYAGWLELTLHWHRLPGWAIVLAGSLLVAWHGSLQHETIHGHPTRWRWVNAAVAAPPLSLWLPYPLYRRAHLAHHAVGALTDPREDPESFYVTPEAWAASGPAVRAVLEACCTLVGRLSLGPLVLWCRFLGHEAKALRAGEPGHRSAWLWHALLVGALAAWLIIVCRVSLTAYLLLCVAPGTSLVLLRSFYEHRPAVRAAEASAITEAGPIATLLFLGNNLHAVHHAAPGMPWYDLGRYYRSHRSEVLARNGGFAHAGYAALLWRHGFHPKDGPVHPDTREAGPPC